MPRLSPAKIRGRLAGSLTSQNACQRLASSDAISSCRSRSTDRKPCSALSNTGNMASVAAMAILDSIWAEPNDVERRDSDLRQALDRRDIGKQHPFDRAKFCHGRGEHQTER